MTVPRVVLLLCAVAAGADGAFLEALGLVALVVVLCVFWPAGVAQRPGPFRVWFPGGRWGRR